LSKPIEEKLLTAKVKMLATLNQLRRRAEELELQLHGSL
jgi:hypothetical protein